MKGSFKVNINSKKINYSFTINRKITILKGLSASGKTKLCKLIENSKSDFSIKIKTDSELYVLPNSDLALFMLENFNNKIIIIDEENIIFKDYYFSKRIKESDNYFIIINRDNLSILPYSYKEIYELTYDKKTNTNYFKRLYKDYENEKIPLYKHDKILVEDSNSGYKMYEEISNNTNDNNNNANDNYNDANDNYNDANDIINWN